jgi:uncharacterized protein DUF4157/putative RNase toxin 14 of polymorphic toxin system
MPVPAPPQHRPPELRVQCRKPEHARDPWEEEAERLQELVVPPGAALVQTIRPVPRDSDAWGTPIDKETASRVRSHLGHPLEPATQHDFETRLNRDLGDVRLHDDLAARDVCRSLGAEAFTFGKDIFTIRSDRALLAHEIVHTVQQEGIALAEPARIQASFERTTTDLDPKVDILLDLHLRSRGKQLKEIAETKLLAPDTWWRKLRAKLEEKNPTSPVDAKAEIEAALKEIRDLASLDTGKGDPIQNGVAGLLADYLRINDAPELAALVVIEFPYSRTTVPTMTVVGALASDKKRAQRGLLPLPRMWNAEKPKGVVAKSWTQEITDVVNQFLALTPLEEHVKQRQKLVDRLKAPIRGKSNIPDHATAPAPFEQLTETSTLTFNELDWFARAVLEAFRKSWANVLEKRIASSQARPGDTVFEIWGSEVDFIKGIVDRMDTPDDPIRQIKGADALLPVMQAAQAELKTELRPPIEAHYSFWASVAESKSQVPGEGDTHLLFAADQGALAVHLQEIAQPLADAASAYFDLFDTRKLPPREDRVTVLQIYARHRERADAFREKLRMVIQPVVTRKIHLARTGGKTELAHALGWFGQWLESIHSTLEDVPAVDDNSKAEAQIDAVAKRLAIAQVLSGIARDALGHSEAEASQSKPSGEQGAGLAEKRNVPAAGAWQAIMTRADAALSLEDIETGMLVLRGPFQESQRSGTDQLTTDLKQLSEVVGGLEPFTGRDLVLFYSAFYKRSMVEELTALSDEAAGREATSQPREKEELWLVQQAADALKLREGSDAMPKRFASRDVFWFEYAKDEPRAFGRLLARQKLYHEFRIQHETPFNIVIHAASGPDEREDAWAWTLPVPGDLVAPLYKVDLLRGIRAMPEEELTSALATGVSLEGLEKEERKAELKRAKKTNADVFTRLTVAAVELGRTIRVDVPPKEGYFNWYDVLNERVRRVREALREDVFGLEAVGKVHREKRTGLEIGLKSAHRDYQLAQRRATTLDRQVIRRMNGKLLQKAIDERIAGQPGIGVALDNHDVFRSAVRPYEPKSEVQRQSAALLLDDADVWLEMVAEARLSGSDKTRTYTVISESLETFPELLREPAPTTAKTEPPEITEHSQGIAWETPAQRESVAKKIAEVTPKFQKALESMKEDLRPLRWELGIRGKAADGKLISNLSPGFPLFTVGKIQEANAKEKDQSEHKSELIPVRGPLALKIVNIHQDFTFLPGVGDRETASAKWQSQHALYIPAQIFVGVSASKESDLGKPTHTEDPTIFSFEAPKDDRGVPLVDVEIWEGNTLFSKFTVHAGDIYGLRSGLNWLTGVVHNAAASEKFASMAADIEMFAHALLFAASVFPPTALAVTAAETLAFLAQVLGNPEFKEALESIAKDPIESLEHAASELKAHFTIERLFDLLLNGNFEPDRFLGAATLRGRKRSDKLTRGSMAKVLTRVKRIGAVLAVRLERFQEAVQGPIHRVEYLMGKHPRLATMVEWLGGHLRDLSDPEGLVLRHPLAGPIYESYLLYRQLGRDEAGASMIGQPLSETAVHLQSGLDRMGHLELPATIVPLDLAIEALVDIAIRLAPKTGKVGIARALAKMAQEGLRATGANTAVYGFLAEQVQGSWADPNRYWRSEVVPQLGPPVKSAIQSAADSVSRQLAAAPLIGDYFGNDRLKNAKVAIPATHRATLPNALAAATANVSASEDADEEFDSAHVADLVPAESGTSEGRELSYSDVREMPDAFFEGIQKQPPASTPVLGGASGSAGKANPPSGSPSLTPGGASRPGPLTPSAHVSSAFASPGGAPLAPSHRAEAERHFGHDLSHVRLHQGRESWAATAQRGADGLTVANHIFLRPDLSPRSGRGQRVMDHELAHVLQKTSDGEAASPPKAGGLRWRPSEESAANQMADQARQNTTGQPIAIKGAHRDGASPAISLDLMETFFKKLSSPSAGSSFAEAIERAHKRHKAAAVHPDTLTVATNLWESIRGSVFGPLPVASHFKLSQQRIKSHLENRLSTLTREGESVPATSKVIAYIAALSEKEPPPPTTAKKKPAAGGTTAPKPKPTFDVPAFLADLSLYVTGRSGIVFDFDISAAELKRLGTDPAAKVSVDTKVSHVELLFVSNLSEPGLALWDAAIRNTTWNRNDDNKDRRDALRKVLEREFGAAAPSSTTAEAGPAPAAGQPAAPKQPARGLGSYTPLWDTSKTDLTLTGSYVEKVETQLSPAALSSDLMPTWGYFADPATEKFFTISSSTSQVKQNAVHHEGKTHEELTGGSFFLAQNRRESHHIVQYLLPEYFANIKEFQPFPKLKPGRNYPGVINSGTRVETISGDGQNIGVGETEKGSRRGHAMPAILLSEETHLNSGLHVTPKPDDTGKATQGYAIHREFRKFLAANVSARLNVKREGDALDDYLLTAVGNAKAEAAVVDAVRQTYAWIKGQNEAQLLAPEGMAGHEADFYISQFRSTPEAKKNFKAINQKEYEADSADVRSRIKDRIHLESQAVLDTAVKVLGQPPLGWKLPGA